MMQRTSKRQLFIFFVGPQTPEMETRNYLTKMVVVNLGTHTVQVRGGLHAHHHTRFLIYLSAIDGRKVVGIWLGVDAQNARSPYGPLWSQDGFAR